MKKILILSIFTLFLMNGNVYSQTGENGRSSASDPVPLFKKITPILKTEIFVSDQDEPNNKTYIADPLYVQGGIGLGDGIVNGEVLGFNTMILRENNLRVFFEDNSLTSSFPANDWLIEINSNVNGGDNYFAIQDFSAATYPFKIMAGATNNSLYVDDNSNIGFGTANPVVKVHAVKGDTPAFRLDQDGSSGWTPQVWDLAGNESNFFIRDVTNSNTLPFRIQPGTPTSSLSIKSTGFVGIGTWSPTEKLQVEGNLKLSGFFRASPLMTVPDSPVEGDIYMDGNDHQLKVYNGTAWETTTDNQNLVDATLTGTVLEIEIENGTSVSIDLQPLIDDLETRVTALEAQSGIIENINYSSARLFQNTPNPYNDQTNISYYIPEEVNNAVLQITDIKGSIVREFIVSDKGKGSIILDESSTESGTYFYTLILDGNKLESKIMVKVD